MLAHPRAGTRPHPLPSQVITVDSDTDEEPKHLQYAEVIEVEDSDNEDEPIIVDPAVKTEPAPGKPPVILSPEQKAVLDRVRAGENVFFTGSAGALDNGCGPLLTLILLGPARYRKISPIARGYHPLSRQGWRHCNYGHDRHSSCQYWWLHPPFLGRYWLGTRGGFQVRW